MGSPKALLDYQGRPFLEHLLEATRHPRVGATRVVLGANAESISNKLKLDRAAVIINREWKKGQLSSIQAAIRSLRSGETDGILLCLIDHPLISAALVGQLVHQFYESGKLIVIPTYNNKRGHPIIFSSALYGELLEAPPEVGARAVVWNHRDDVLEMPTEEEGVVLNLNDPDTLQRAISGK
jgi:molybdenum cofactor cytidylyltransferase